MAGFVSCQLNVLKELLMHLVSRVSFLMHAERDIVCCSRSVLPSVDTPVLYWNKCTILRLKLFPPSGRDIWPYFLHVCGYWLYNINTSI